MKPFAKKLTKPISLEQWPAIECPICDEGTLGFGEPGEPTTYIRPYYNSDLFYERDGDQESVGGVFSAPLVCNAGKCKCTTIATGDFGLREVTSYGDGPQHEKRYRVRGFHPAISVVELTEDVPTPVSDELARVGALVWSDPGAAVTALRASVEHLLDAQGIGRDEPTSKGIRFLTLKDRILAFQREKNDAVGKWLDAVRHVGNVGTHGKPPTAEDVLKVVDIVETALEKLYPPSKHASAAAHAEQILKDHRRG